MKSGWWTQGVFITLGGLQAHDSFGRDDNSIVNQQLIRMETPP